MGRSSCSLWRTYISVRTHGMFGDLSRIRTVLLWWVFLPQLLNRRPERGFVDAQGFGRGETGLRASQVTLT